MVSRRGVALLMTMLIMALVGTIAIQLQWVTGIEAHLSSNQLAETQNSAAIQGGVNLASTFLLSDLADDPDKDSHRDIWADPKETGQPIGEASDPQITMSIRSEEAKINLNLLAREEVRDLAEELIKKTIAELGYEEALADSIIDRVDAVTGESGGRSLATIYDLISEDISYAVVVGDSLALLEEGYEFDEEVYGLNDVFTVLSSGDLNVNLLPAPVFGAVCEILPDTVKSAETAELVESYLEYVGSPDEEEEGTDIEEVKGLSEVEGFDTEKMAKYLQGEGGTDNGALIRQFFSVVSTTFRAEISVTNDGVIKRAEAFLSRNASENYVRLLFLKDLGTSR